MNKLIIALVSTAFLISCSDGTDGIDGEIGPSGYLSLVKVTSLSVGDENCPYGGSQIDTGIDNGDGEGIAGNEILEDGEIDNTAYICNGSDANGSGDDGSFVDEFEFSNFGSNALDDFTSVAISDRYPDTNVQDETRMAVYVDKSVDPDSVSRVRSLVRFGGLRETVNDEIDERYPSGAISDKEILGATLYVLMETAPFVGSSYGDIDYIEFGPRSLDGSNFPTTASNQDYDANTVTWNEIAPGDDWGVPGLYNSVDQKDGYQLVSNAFSPPSGSVWYVFRLDTSTIDIAWLQDTHNRGFLFSMNELFIEERGSDVSVDMTLTDMLLHIEMELEDVTVTSGRVSNESNNTLIKPWDERTEAEKWTPLNRYLSSQ